MNARLTNKIRIDFWLENEGQGGKTAGGGMAAVAVLNTQSAEHFGFLEIPLSKLLNGSGANPKAGY